jgi:hypothetical protein
MPLLQLLLLSTPRSPVKSSLLLLLVRLPFSLLLLLLADLWWHDGWAQVCECVEACPQAQQTTLRTLLSRQCVPLVAAKHRNSHMKAGAAACCYLKRMLH